MPNPAPRKPDFFILGAGKSGTTSLYSCLRQHPQIFMSPVKEPSFFCDLFQVVSNPIDYLTLFQDAAGHHSRIGEASHVYLTCPGTAPVLRAFFPEARFILILRNPVDRAYSLYHHMVRMGYEWLPSFEKALQVEESRAGDPVFAKKNPQYLYNFLYFRSGLYGEQIERYFHWFERDRFLFLTLDDLMADPQPTMERIWRFLDVDLTFVPNMEVHNSGTGTRKAAWQYFLRHRLRPAIELVKRLPETRAVRWLKAWSRRSTPIPPIQAQTRSNLQARYADDLRRTQELTGLDLSDWIPSTSESAVRCDAA